MVKSLRWPIEAERLTSAAYETKLAFPSFVVQRVFLAFTVYVCELSQHVFMS